MRERPCRAASPTYEYRINSLSFINRGRVRQANGGYVTELHC
jgi:hypothetical protein